jgi:hypothetical protein
MPLNRFRNPLCMAYFWVYLSAMRRKGFFLGVMLGSALLVVNPALAQSNEVVDQVKEAIKAGSAKELSKFLSQTIDVTIDGKIQNYSKAQAEFVLRDFFKAHPPSDFSIIHQGSSKGGQPFAIGKYITGEDQYRVWMKIKAVNKEQLIHEISFVKQ